MHSTIRAISCDNVQIPLVAAPYIWLCQLLQNCTTGRPEKMGGHDVCTVFSLKNAKMHDLILKYRVHLLYDTTR